MSGPVGTLRLLEKPAQISDAKKLARIRAVIDHPGVFHWAGQDVARVIGRILARGGFVTTYSHPCDKCGGAHQGTCTSHLWGLVHAALRLAASLLLFVFAGALGGLCSEH
jgi:hypothetical protein